MDLLSKKEDAIASIYLPFRAGKSEAAWVEVTRLQGGGGLIQMV